MIFSAFPAARAAALTAARAAVLRDAILAADGPFSDKDAASYRRFGFLYTTSARRRRARAAAARFFAWRASRSA